VPDDVHEFKPDWTIAPAAVLREWLDDHGLRPEVLAVACAGKAHKALALTLIRGVLDKQPYHQPTADLLARGTGVSARMWLALEHGYRAGLAAGLIDTTPEETHG
jgi:hypothetical protein